MSLGGEDFSCLLMLRGLGGGSSVVADANANADAIDPSWLRFLSMEDDDMMVGTHEGPKFNERRRAWAKRY